MGIVEMDVWVLAAVCGAVLVATVTQQLSGFGFALVAVPMVALVVGPKDAVAVAMAVGFASSGLVALELRDRIEKAALRRLLFGAALGLPLGVLGLRSLDPDLLRLALAAVVLAMVLVLARGYRLQAHGPRATMAAGVASGLLNGSLGTGGPPVIVVLQASGMEQHRFRATCTAFFAICDVVAVPLLVASGAVRSSAWLYSVAALPAVVVGNAVGGRLAFRVDQQQFRRLVLCLLVVTALMLLAAALRS